MLAASAGAGALGGAVGAAATLLLSREIVVGFCLGLVASAVFRAAEIAGRLGDTLRGANMAEILVPTADERASPLGASTSCWPRSCSCRSAAWHAWSRRCWRATGRCRWRRPRRRAAHAGRAGGRGGVGQLIASGLALAAPVVVALWLADLALGLIARAAPPVPVYFVGLPLKGLLAIGVVLVGLAMLQASVARGFASWLQLLSQAVAALRG